MVRYGPSCDWPDDRGRAACPRPAIYSGGPRSPGLIIMIHSLRLRMLRVRVGVSGRPQYFKFKLRDWPRPPASAVPRAFNLRLSLLLLPFSLARQPCQWDSVRRNYSDTVTRRAGRRPAGGPAASAGLRLRVRPRESGQRLIPAPVTVSRRPCLRLRLSQLDIRVAGPRVLPPRAGTGGRCS